MDEKELWLSTRSPTSDPFFVTLYLDDTPSSDKHMEKLMSHREGLQVEMECYMRHLYADRYWLDQHPRGHPS